MTKPELTEKQRERLRREAESLRKNLALRKKQRRERDALERAKKDSDSEKN